jgi:hypothetical protein
MSDNPTEETPAQRALRMKKSALASKQGPPGGGGKHPKPAASGVPTGASKPWMKR